MSLWFKAAVVKFKKGVPGIMRGCPLILFGSVIFTLRWMLWVSISYMVRYATRVFIAKILFDSLIRLGPLNTMVPFTFITMTFGFDQHRSKLDA